TWQFDSSLSVSYLGTDEWDNNQNTLANSHFSISGFGAATYEIVSPDYFTSIQENAINNDNINIFPNPGNGIFHISSNLQDSDTDLEIINLLGNIIYTCKLNTNRMKIDINHQKAGIYFIRIKRNKETILNKKIIIVD
ncbi:MAG: T9SS type A sorting domain-containing protein, partial [Bacteroidia bacterium]